MADNENAFERRAAQRMQRSRRQSEQHRVLAKVGRDRDNAGSRSDQKRGGSAMNAPNGVAEAFRARNEHLRSDRDPASGPASTTRPTLS